MENIFDGRVVGRTATGVSVDLGFTRIEVPSGADEAEVKVGLHGEHVTLSRTGGGLGGTVVDVRYLGEATRCQVRVGEATLVANISPREVVRAGDPVSLDIDPSSWVVLAK
jgi:ABC-type sugar transport system ATPase subunit